MSAEPARARVTLVTRAQCHLCEDARRTVARVCAEAGVRWDERDVDDSPEELARWSDLVPVVLVDGAQHDIWAVDPARLRAALGR